MRELVVEAARVGELDCALESVPEDSRRERDVLSVRENVSVADKEPATVDDRDGEYVIVWVEPGVPVPSVRDLE